MSPRLLLLCLLGLAPSIVRAQTAPLEFAAGEFRLTAFGGPAFFTNASPRPILLGLSLDGTLLHPGSANAPAVGLLVEGGLFHPALSGTGNFYVSTNALFASEPPLAAARSAVRPFATAGYTRLFNTTGSSISTVNAVNFGVGADRTLRDDVALRVELRDQYVPSTAGQALVLRIGLIALIPTQ